MPPKSCTWPVAERAVASEARIVLVDALPGTGRAKLLQRVAARVGTEVRDAGRPVAGAPLVATLNPDERIDPSLVPGRIIVVAAPRQVAGYARWRLSGELLEIGNRDLFRPAPGEAHAGWPLLEEALSRGSRRESDVARWVREEVWPSLETTRRDLLLAICRNGGLREESLSHELQEALAWLSPLAVTADAEVKLASSWLLDVFRAATSHLPVSQRVSQMLEAAGDPAAAISGALAAGHRQHALAILSRSGGVAFGHLHGQAAASRTLAAFGDDPDPTVVALRVETTLKAGNTERARHVLGQALGHENMDLERVLGDGEVHDALRLARFLLVIYLGEPVPFAATSGLTGLLARLPMEAHLYRGLVHNVMVDVHLRAGRLGEADAAAGRALMHFEAGGAPYLAFYIRLYQGLIHLHRGEPGRALSPLAAAVRALAATPFETPQDAVILSLAQAQVDYERGEPAPMAAFAERALEVFVYGELWPSIAGQALAFGAEALLQLRGMKAALDYLDVWRAQAIRGRHFRLMAEQREVAILQGGRRWREARKRLEMVATRIGRVWMDTSGTNLTDLRSVEDIAQAMLWLRQQVFERPRDPALIGRLMAFEANPRLSWRQVQCLRLWRAWAARRQGRLTEARTILADVMEAGAARDCRAPIMEERVFVLPLLEDGRMMQGPMRGAPIPPGLKRGGTAAFGAGPLTRQEWRALLLLAEGCSNKEIAREMALSVPTVKFHLKHVYAKLEACGRREAVARARDNGLLDG